MRQHARIIPLIKHTKFRILANFKTSILGHDLSKGNSDMAVILVELRFTFVKLGQVLARASTVEGPTLEQFLGTLNPQG